MASVAVLHGWSDKGESFRPLRDFLAANGFGAQDVFLGNYISLDDDVRVEDVAKRMDVVVQALIASGKLSTPFDLIVHSTGALVARQWMLDLHRTGAKPPVRRLVMLAPANFGSKLAAVGKSMIGRITKGLSNRLETGREMLKALELASPYQWTLARQDLLAPPGSDDDDGPFGEGGVMPFVIIGTRAYDSGLQQIVNEDGSDGTVRVAAADLNAIGLTIDFSAGDNVPKLTPWRNRTAARTPLAVLPERDHSEITHPEQDGQALPPFSKRLGELILAALRCETSADYAAIDQAWRTISDDTADLALNPQRIDAVFGDLDRPSPAHFHRYLQLVVMVRDDYGNLVGDYFLEFGEPAKRSGKSTVTFHRDVLAAVHTNSTHPAYRCLYIDHTDLLRVFYDEADELAVSVSAAPVGRNIKYFDSRTDTASGQIRLHTKDIDNLEKIQARLFRNQTHLIEVIIPRRPIDKVFSFLP